MHKTVTSTINISVLKPTDGIIKQDGDVSIKCEFTGIDAFDTFQILKREGSVSKQIGINIEGVKEPFDKTRYNYVFNGDTTNDKASITLTIKGIKAEDSGYYECAHKEDKRGKEINVFVPLHKLKIIKNSGNGWNEVTIPPSKILYVSLTDKIGCVYEMLSRGRLSSTKIDKNNQTLSYNIFVDEEDISSKFKVHVINTQDLKNFPNFKRRFWAQSSLSANVIPYEFNGKTFKCCGETQGFDKQEISATLNLTGEPIIKCPRGINAVSVNEKLKANITCEFYSNPNYTTILWSYLKNNKQYDTYYNPKEDTITKKSHDKYKHTVIFELQNLNTDSFINYKLRITNKLGNSTAMTRLYRPVAEVTTNSPTQDGEFIENQVNIEKPLEKKYSTIFTVSGKLKKGIGYIAVPSTKIYPYTPKRFKNIKIINEAQMERESGVYNNIHFEYDSNTNIYKGKLKYKDIKTLSSNLCTKFKLSHRTCQGTLDDVFRYCGMSTSSIWRTNEENQSVAINVHHLKNRTSATLFCSIKETIETYGIIDNIVMIICDT
ncbi:hypothetical protein A3Q56_04212 [Intoshia linei]|uniref:Immunoglobulin domain-containing protein n=1 Tax=Intoshia linei TaxID=1819745 RepID=A0A177B2U9_9BILA|nr:hypothetical protein A3Q56_04212 [Intoshia linei]